jgi:hypothetical protein
MKHPSTIDELLEPLPDPSDERDLFKSIYEIVRSLDIEHSEREGMAVIAALESSEIVFDDGRVLGVPPLEVGIEDVSRILAIELRDVQSNPIVWKAGYPIFLLDPTFEHDRLQMRERVARLSFVSDVR